MQEMEQNKDSQEEKEIVAKWYSIHTYSGYENIVVENLKKIVENNNMQDRILEIQVPVRQDIEEKNGRKKVVLKKIYPSYVFVKLKYDTDIWYVITNIRGVTGFVGPMGKAQALTNEEVQRMELESKIDLSSININIGDTINVVAGPLSGYCGTIVNLDMDSQKAKVSVAMFGRETEVELTFVQISKA